MLVINLFHQFNDWTLLTLTTLKSSESGCCCRKE